MAPEAEPARVDLQTPKGLAGGTPATFGIEETKTRRNTPKLHRPRVHNTHVGGPWVLFPPSLCGVAGKIYAQFGNKIDPINATKSRPTGFWAGCSKTAEMFPSSTADRTPAVFWCQCGASFVWIPIKCFIWIPLNMFHLIYDASACIHDPSIVWIPVHVYTCEAGIIWIQLDLCMYIHTCYVLTNPPNTYVCMECMRIYTNMHVPDWVSMRVHATHMWNTYTHA